MKIYDVLEYLLENQSSSNPEEIPTQLLNITDEGGNTAVFQVEVPIETMTWREFLTNPTYVDIMKNANLFYILEDQYFSGIMCKANADSHLAKDGNVVTPDDSIDLSGLYYVYEPQPS